MSATEATHSNNTGGAPRCASKHFTLLAAEGFINREEPDWLIDEILPHAGLASIYGQSGVGKSFISLDMAAAIAEGNAWFGFPTKQSDVVYVALEGEAGFPRRVKAWSAHHQRPFPSNIKFVFDPFALNKPEHTKELGDLITQSGGAGLVIIDTLNRAAPGADENTSGDMGRIIAGATSLQQAIGGMVLLIHHAGKEAGRGLRGHSSLKAALDTTLCVDRQEELVRWTLDKSKDSEDQVGRLCSLTKVEVGLSKSGKLLHSCVVTEVEGTASLAGPKEPKGDNQRAILSEVRGLLVNRRIQAALCDPAWPDDYSEGIPYPELLTQIKDTLVEISDKHRMSRTKEALNSIISKGFLVLREGLVCLPTGPHSKLTTVPVTPTSEDEPK